MANHCIGVSRNGIRPNVFPPRNRGSAAERAVRRRGRFCYIAGSKSLAYAAIPRFRKGRVCSGFIFTSRARALARRSALLSFSFGLGSKQFQRSRLYSEFEPVRFRFRSCIAGYAFSEAQTSAPEPTEMLFAWLESGSFAPGRPNRSRKEDKIMLRKN